MAGNDRNAGQPKGAGRGAMTLEQTAFGLLLGIMQQSYDKKAELGAVICRDTRTDALAATKLREGMGGNAVDVGLAEPNCGCPTGSVPVAFYHTHPTDEVDGGGGATLHGDPDFSERDMDLANDHQITAYLGAFDGSFRRYLPAEQPTTMVNGKPVQRLTDDEGRVLPKRYNKPEILNGKLPKRPR